MGGFDHCLEAETQHEGAPVPGENLTRDEARERAELLSVDGYDVALRSALGDRRPDRGPGRAPSAR